MTSLADPTTAAKPRRHARGGRACALLAAVATAWLLALGLLYATGYRPLVVTSASMAPTVASGDLIVTRAVAPGAIARGDVVSFHDRTRQGRLVTHRVVTMRRERGRIAFVTRGDVNSGVERWSSATDARVGRLALRVPLAGYAVTWVTRLPIVLALLALVLLAFAHGASAARRTERATRRISRSALAALASAATVVSMPIMLASTQGAYSAVAANPANSFAAAANFCALPDVTVGASADTTVDQGDADVNSGNSTSLGVIALPGSLQRSLLKFNFPTPPADTVLCPLRTATLQLTTNFAWSTGRTLHARRATAAWGELTATWNNQPASSATDVAATATVDGLNSLDVTNQVKTMYLGSNNGFLVRDSAENAFAIQSYNSRNAASNRPALVFSYG